MISLDCLLCIINIDWICHQRGNGGCLDLIGCRFQLCRPRMRIMMMGTIRHAVSAAFSFFVTEQPIRALFSPPQYFYFTMVNVEQLVEDIIKNNKVVIFSKSYCRKSLSFNT